VIHNPPYSYRLEQLAARWGVPPWLLETDDPEVGKWVLRGLEFQSIEYGARNMRKVV
jgi:hypothetical protein